MMMPVNTRTGKKETVRLLPAVTISTFPKIEWRGVSVGISVDTKKECSTWRGTRISVDSKKKDPPGAEITISKN